MNLSNTELVVLSACDTALGKVLTGEGVFGLLRSFVLAGAKALVMSLWKVPDEQTKELLINFYRNMLAGKPSAAALREAQLEIKEKTSKSVLLGSIHMPGKPSAIVNSIPDFKT